jgi:DNA-binding NarL/FixJ family response regulator
MRDADLTGIQARIADGIARGVSQRALARELCIRRGDVRSHIAAVYRKTGTRSPDELARWLCIR